MAIARLQPRFRWGPAVLVLLVASAGAMPAMADEDAAARIAGVWFDEDGGELTVHDGGYTYVTPHWTQEGVVGRDRSDVPGDACAVFFRMASGKAIAGFYQDLRRQQIEGGWTDAPPLPAALEALEGEAVYPVMTANCYEVGYDWVLTEPTEMVRFGAGEGMIEPAEPFRRVRTGTGTGTPGDDASPPPDAPAFDDLTLDEAYRYWRARCHACAIAEDTLCNVETAGAGAPLLSVGIDAGGGVRTVRLPPLDWEADGPVEVRIDDEPAFRVATRFYGLDATLNIDDPADIRRVIEGFRRGYTVRFTAAEAGFPDYRHAYTLIGFSDSLDAALANAPAGAPPCPG